ncbi:protein C3orf33 homolog isoform X1 [Gadus morhua]|uniref:Chromosome 3 open reading frame 33 n=1 Tax=Gadus morhua TaxID=8049 RepID=A0A8C5AR86_GADMO|nr:protein C3orf33 homolog isoform X1 [Gadus morhua]
MPGTESRADRQPQEAIHDIDEPNIVSLISHFADDNLTIVRNLSTGLALAGVLVIARSIKLTSKFGAVAEIPVHFIRGNVSLQGRVRTVSDHGLEIEHIPVVLPILSRLLSKRVCSSSLAVRLAGVEPTAEGQLWLRRHLAPAQVVWFKLISREDHVLHCLVSHRKQGAFWSLCVNEELLRLGLARTVPLFGVAPGSRLYWRLYRRLLRAEFKAEKKGLGLWKEAGFWERASDSVRYNRLISAVKRLFGRT